MIKDAVENGIEVEASDTRNDPYIVYVLIDSKRLQSIGKYKEGGFDIMTAYDLNGRPILTQESLNYKGKIGKILVRTPLWMAKELQ